MDDHRLDAKIAMVADVLARHGRVDVLVNNAWGAYDFHEEADGEEVWDEPMEQFRAMLLAGAYSDFVTDMAVLEQQPDLNAGRF
jgi:NAD(P)-dependent dehydrogenase (short-subunit alcohol dehydrogenase family)